MKKELTSIVPSGPRVLVLKEADSGMTKGGIALPDTAKIPTRNCRILAVSPQVEHDFDYVNIRKYSKAICSLARSMPASYEDGENRFLIPVEDVIAVYESSDDDNEEKGALVVA
jgi:co-chaperonin GroES (HSP10)